LSSEPQGRGLIDSEQLSSLIASSAYEVTNLFHGSASVRSVPGLNKVSLVRDSEFSFKQTRPRSERTKSQLIETWKELSSWSRSATKRFFDCVCVALALPLLIPVMLLVGLLVRVTSHGPVLFLQKRMGMNGRAFTILKFRTMVHVEDAAHHPITTSDNQRFTPVGPFLRRWKLDELPQLLNVLIGDMSLVGPRPKLQQHVLCNLPCRPGITGMATMVFACEERVLAGIARDHLDSYYHQVILPAKRQLDSEYMARATFFSDLRLLVNSVLRRWDPAALDDIIVATAAEWESKSVPAPRQSVAARPVLHLPRVVGPEHQLQAERAIS
jgi:lipopolysaccharide/colanic/teichoic acid biosynthesis glycosyltransferase